MMRDIGKNIKDLRSRKKLTQDALAELLFVTRQTVSNYETGKSRPDIDMLIRIAEVLDADVHEVLYGPAAVPDRRPEFLRFAVAAGICLTLWGLTAFLETLSGERYFAYIASFQILVHSLFYPFAFLISGWAVLQLLSIFTGLRPLSGTCVPWLRRAVLLILAGAFLLLLPFYGSVLWSSIQYLISRAQGATEYMFTSPFPLTRLSLFLLRILSEHPAVLSLLGAILWLLDVPKHNTQRRFP